MIRVEKSMMLDEKIAQLNQIKTIMQEHNDPIRVQQMSELVEKLKHGGLYIAVCGHFSAGKSSLINKLCGINYLPSGPIPASANVVTIRDGEPSSTVIHHSKDARQQNKRVQVPLQELESYCLNGSAIARVELSVPSVLLRDNNITLLDTPGIDSTDERHHQATSAALHLADIVFYVVDYNHVESEHNLQFAKRVKELGKPFYLLINQIDKHREQELPLAKFRQRVAASFHDWHADPAHTLLISVKEQLHPHNEWDRLIWLLSELGKQANSLSRSSTIKAMKKCIDDHIETVFERDQHHERERLRGLISDVDRERVNAEIARILAEITSLETAPDELETVLKSDIQQLLEQAHIMPAVTRDKAEAYLESEMKEFKVGFFATKKRTELEKSRRTELFLKELQENIDTQIDWHLQQLFQHQVGAGLDPFQIKLTHDDLKKELSRGAVASGQYTIQYCRDLANAIRLRFRREAWAKVDEFVTKARSESTIKINALKREQQTWTAVQQAYDQRAALDRQQESANKNLQRLIPIEMIEEVRLPNLDEGPAIRAVKQTNDDKGAHEHVIEQVNEAAPIEPTQLDRFVSKHEKAKVQHAAERLEKTAEQLMELPAMEQMAQYLQARAERLKQNRFTIALFGAFSAGKSSFVNAMLGADVVPVSPNPTTAVVNRIMPATAKKPHGTATIKMKSRQMLEEEFAYAFELLGEPFDHLEQAIKHIHHLSPQGITGSAKVQVAFLKAAAAGWTEMAPLLGKTLQVGMDEYRLYAADESRSGFVASIDLYQQAAITEQGIVFVDTPGADSVNARHTGVAFDYIKNADAIIYVTYYNHAFSQADREFLLQLGRVKDSFSLDKMFFLINAADLATTKNELDLVVDHVTTNLASCEIRHPNIYAISSLEALQAKSNGDMARLNDSGFVRFERDFYSFVFDELADLLVKTVDDDISQCVQALEQWLKSLDSEQSERDQKKQTLLQFREKLPLTRQRQTAEVFANVEGEIRERMYYVKQRILFRYNETFSRAFHPSRLSDNVGEIRLQLRLAWRELIAILSVQCSQEVQAITLKVENLCDQALHEEHTAQLHELRQSIPSFPGYDVIPFEFDMPSIDEQLIVPDQEERWLMRQFKNAKSFFEQGGAKKLRDALEGELMTAVSDYVDEHTERFVVHYASEFKSLEQACDDRLAQRVRVHLDGVIQSLTDQSLVDTIARKKTIIQNYSSYE